MVELRTYNPYTIFYLFYRELSFCQLYQSTYRIPGLIEYFQTLYFHIRKLFLGEIQNDLFHFFHITKIEIIFHRMQFRNALNREKKL